MGNRKLLFQADEKNYSEEDPYDAIEQQIHC